MVENTQTWDGKTQPKDEDSAGSPWFYRHSWETILKGMKKLHAELEKYNVLSKELGLEVSPYKSELWTTGRIIGWIEEQLEKNINPESNITIGGATWGSLRYVKAALLLAIDDEVRALRAKASRFGRLPTSLVSSFNIRLETIRSLAESGMLNGLKPAEIFLELGSIGEPTDATAPSPEGEVESQKRNVHFISVIPIVDPELRNRCIRLLDVLDEKTVPSEIPQESLDTVVSEMCRILENRVRTLANLTREQKDFLSLAFAGEKPLIIVGDSRRDQSDMYKLFLGFYSYARNLVQHKLVRSYTRNHVLQLLGMADHLLFLLSMAQNGPESIGRTS